MIVRCCLRVTFLARGVPRDVAHGSLLHWRHSVGCCAALDVRSAGMQVPRGRAGVHRRQSCDSVDWSCDSLDIALAKAGGGARPARGFVISFCPNRRLAPVPRGLVRRDPSADSSFALAAVRNMIKVSLRDASNRTTRRRLRWLNQIRACRLRTL